MPQHSDPLRVLLIATLMLIVYLSSLAAALTHCLLKTGHGKVNSSLLIAGTTCQNGAIDNNIINSQPEISVTLDVMFSV